MKLGESSNNYTLDVEIDPKSGGLSFTIEYPFPEFPDLWGLYKALADPYRVTRILRTVLKDATDTLNFVDARFGSSAGSSAADWEELESVVEARELLDELDSRVAPPTSTATSYRIGDGPDAYWEDGHDE